MTREWQPGDVAMVRQFFGDERIALVGTYRDAVKLGPHFLYTAGGYDAVRGKASEARPLVVIDPENPAHIEQLFGALRAKVGMATITEALRSLVAPPKPEEPTGLGAVVEDDEGKRWVRWHADGASHRSQDRPWCAANGAGNDRHYADINAVRVLSEGVTA